MLIGIVFSGSGLQSVIMTLFLPCLLMLSISVAVMTVVVDIIYAWIDPRIRVE